MRKKYVIIVAGGRGLRMGGDLPKQFIPIEGKPVLMHTLEAFYRWDDTVELILILPEDHQSYWKMLCKEIGSKAPHQIVNGGETRFHSVRNGLQFLKEKRIAEGLSGEKALIAIHDGVRPLVNPEVISRCFTEAELSGASIPVVPVVDSLREMTEKGSHPVDRSRYLAVQTPQVFDFNLLVKAYEQTYTELFTDDASVVEAMGHEVKAVPGNRENIKITTPMDLLLAEALIRQQQ
ncbi:MAG: 2-C-methyl-D-erythritol 4-phosphate cytidylyltransferase [Parabacteroides distasonis]|nr:2-C-methyl-D-erythritol 4-phosphate cytidylyltransferase [Parabacteroides distasonis]